MDDLDPEIKDGEMEEEIEEEIIPGTKKPKGPKDLDETSLDDLADEEEESLPEDSFDDVDLW